MMSSHLAHAMLPGNNAVPPAAAMRAIWAGVNPLLLCVLGASSMVSAAGGCGGAGAGAAAARTG